MRARREAKEAAAAAVAAEKQSEKQHLDAVLREYKPRKGGTAKWKKGSKVLVPHTDQARPAGVVRAHRGRAGSTPPSGGQKHPQRARHEAPAQVPRIRAPACRERLPRNALQLPLPVSSSWLQYYAAVVVQGQKREDGQWYMLHYEGTRWAGLVCAARLSRSPPALPAGRFHLCSALIAARISAGRLAAARCGC